MEVQATIKNSNIKLGEDEETNRNNEKVFNKMEENGSKRELSEGEASSDFETVSSISSKNDLDGLDLDLSSENEDYNVAVQIENEIAIQHFRQKQNRKQNSCLCDYYCSGNVNKSNSKSRSDCYLNESTRVRYGRHTTTDDKLKAYTKKIRHEKRRCEEEKSNSYRRSRWSINTEKGDHDRHKHRRSYEGELRRSRDYSYGISRKFRSLERKSRSRSLTHRDSRKRTKEGRVGGDFYTYQDVPKLHPKRRSNPRSESKFLNDVKRDASETSSNFFSEGFRINNEFPKRKKSRWEHNLSVSKPIILERQKFTRSDEESDKRFNPLNIQNKAKNRIPSLGKLGTKLKGAEMMKKSAGEKRVQINVASTPDSPSPLSQTFSNPLVRFPAPIKHPNIGRPLLYAPFPSFSTDKLPLIPGPTGLPVYIAISGGQIPHDVEGRRIPAGLNGHYLSLDPTGRLFPHIVSPGNVAVPIYLSDDGVLRLPNSEPVAFGPPHQLPVNIDGRIIVMGPNTKPLNPSPNTPKHLPLQFYSEFSAAKLYCGVGVNPLGEASARQPSLQNEINASQTRQGVLRCSKLQKIVGVNFLEGEIIRSAPLKVEEKEMVKSEKCYESGPNMVLDFGDSKPSSVSKSAREIGGSRNCNEKPSPDEECAPQIACDVLKNKNPEVPRAEEKAEDPIVKKIQLTIKSLKEKDSQPSLFGRFVLFDPFPADSLQVKFRYESPLLRSRIKLPFTTEFFPKSVSKKVEEPSPERTFGFFAQRKGGETLEKPFGSGQNRSKGKMNPANKFPSAFAVDVGMQCDSTSEAIRSLNEKLFEATQKIVRLKKANAKLLKNYSQVQADYEKKSSELKKAYSELAEKNNEMYFPKRASEERTE